MAYSKARELRRLLPPQGFKSKNKAYYRIVGDTVQAIKLCRQRYLNTIVDVAVYSIYCPDLPEYFEPSPVLPYGYNSMYFAGKTGRERVYLSEEEQANRNCFFLDEKGAFNFYEASAEEELEFVRAFVLPRLDKVQTARDALDLYDELDCFISGKRHINKAVRVYAALAAGEYDLCREALNAIFAQNDDALESNRKDFAWNEEEYKIKCEELAQRQKTLRKVERLINSEDDELQNFLEQTKDKNLAYFAE